MLLKNFLIIHTFLYIGMCVFNKEIKVLTLNFSLFSDGHF